ncbi:hypothetical protein DB346_06325 [Verrucomicrobia bacterium LW23]|nr:hypothetical protein DB346_06325 [Verrucomicrobia bacterium LW23]
MSATFTKLFSSITESTIWCESSDIRIVWITMLAMADQYGRVWGSVPGLANRARVPVDVARKALTMFLAPDADSRTTAFEGRRIEPMDGGWRLLNHARYRSMRDEDARRAYKAEKERGYRAARVDKKRGQNGQSWTAVDPHGHNAEAESYADAYTERINEDAGKGSQGSQSSWGIPPQAAADGSPLAPSFTLAQPDFDEVKVLPGEAPCESSIHVSAGQKFAGESGSNVDGQAQKSARAKPQPAELPTELDTDAFRATWAKWSLHRKEKRKPLTPTSVQQQLLTLAEWGEARAIAAINHSILGGYQGIFEPNGCTSVTGGSRRASGGKSHRMYPESAPVLIVEPGETY